MTAEAFIVVVTDGDSPEVPRRDFRRVGDRPLLSWAIAAALETVPPAQVAVLTQEDEPAELAAFSGVRAIRSLSELDAAPGSALVELHSAWPFVSPAALRRGLDLLAGGSSRVVSVTRESRPIWREGATEPDAGDAVIELGAIRGSRVSAPGDGPVGFVELTGPEALEISGFDDLEAARHWVRRLSIIVRTDAARELGMGHVYRSLALAHELAPHRLQIVTSADKPLGGQFFDRTPFEHVAVSSEEAFVSRVIDADADLVILDLLDTDAEFIALLRAARPGVRIVSFEDHGSGSHEVDLLVCDIYENPSVPRDRQLIGIEHALLSPSFETFARTSREPVESVDEVLILFGGTDPSGLAVKSLHALASIGFAGHVTVVRGLGADALDVSGYGLDADVRTDVRNMAELMSTADLALSSAGRTLAELASIGVPTLCMAQNDKELRHTHSTRDHGVVLLGLGSEVADHTLAAALRDLIGDVEQRRALRSAGLAMTRDRRNSTVVDEILRRVG